ncbi:peptidoglycan DD-metalloendopeptidase family protein [Bacteroidota bacterium]
MIGRIVTILLLICATISSGVVAQPFLDIETYPVEDEGKWVSTSIKKPKFDYSVNNFSESIHDISYYFVRRGGVSIKIDDPVFFNPPVYNTFRSKPLPLPAYFKISENVKVDSIWVKHHDYYAIWNMTRLNPYEIDGLEWKDTVNLQLYDMLTGEDWAFPLKRSIITSDFGLRRVRWHNGADLRVKVGEPVFAAFDGIVRIAIYDRYGFGRFVVLRHRNGLETIYGHLYRFKVKVGDVVKAGELIGLGGNSGRSTAPHLHFEIRYAGNAINPHNLYDFNETKLKDNTYTVKPQDFAYLEEARKIVYHKVRYGETLSGIGYRYGVSVRQLCRLNTMSRNSILRTGRTLRIK